MSNRNAIIVLGYNNTRINDVKKIREKANKFFNAVTILCKKYPTPEDEMAVDGVIDAGLDGADENVNVVAEKIKDLSLNVIAFLPFSDQGTQLAGALSKKFSNLRLPNAEKVKVALDKHFFRECEQRSQNIPAGYQKIQSKKITEYEQLNSLHNELNGRVFLKPAKEGNSRGCFNLMGVTDLKNCWQQIEQYVANGVVAEELVLDAVEYSWDHVNDSSWITEKKTSNNQYRTEFQHIVPAPLNETTTNSVVSAGKFIAELAGYNGGACHNEIFYFPVSGNVAAVEPNLRPAGGRIWDLASLAFDDFDPWKEWMTWASGFENSNKKELKQNYYAGIRKIQSPAKGTLNCIPEKNLDNLLSDDVEVMDLVWTKKLGDAVTDIPKDNSEYLGYVIGRSKNYNTLSSWLENSCLALQNTIKIDVGT